MNEVHGDTARHGGASGPEADARALRVFRARRIISLADGTDAARPQEPEAFATLGERIVATGDWADLRSRFPAAEPVDLGDAVVVPGLNDAHCHPAGLADTRLRVSLTAEAMSTGGGSRALLADKARATPPGRWVVAEGYNPAADPHGRLDRAALDAVSREHPVLAVHFSCHMAVANSRALELAGHRDTDADPPGGTLGRNPDGSLDGWMYEGAWFDEWFRPSGAPELLGEFTLDDLVPSFAEVCREFHAAGITSWCDALVSPREIRLYQEAARRGVLTARVGMLVWHRYFADLQRTGLGTGFGSEHLRLVGVKMMIDGALAGGTCLCRAPYPSQTGADNGIQLMGDEEFAAAVRAVHDAGSRVAVHANGDLAVGKVLDAIEAARAAEPRYAATNHRIEHCSLVDDDLIARIAAAGVTPVPFGSFLHEHGDKLRGYYGDERAAAACAHRRFLDAGIAVGGSSDHPAGPLPPLLAIRTMVTRATDSGEVLGPDLRVTPRQALEVYTVGSAHATGEGHLKGRLVPGMLADFTVLGEDLLATPPERIADIPVLSTWVGARRVWAA
ncbi:amidohydrolase [Yinghuangia seranimata]|uniref:amidohydrolase n=1 Tax=Yinghuangia seranimata TaxID=408067 RepID=UPI00248CC423|nr:amidohydrolase [Yinghuangia seranimata]MDI2128449.1 amidohydrolase [Yinghuangia seranimata]